MKRLSQLALLLMMPLAGLLVLSLLGRHQSEQHQKSVLPQAVQATRSSNQIPASRGNNTMANPQLVIGGPAVTVPLAINNTPPSGQALPVNPPGSTMVFYINGVNIFPSNPQVTAVPFTINGVTVSAAVSTGSSPQYYSSVTLQAVSNAALSNFIGANIIIAGTNGSYSQGLVDISGVALALPGAPANPIATFAAGAVAVSATPRPAGESVTSYKCYRDQNGGGFAVIGTNPTPNFSDPAPQLTAGYTRGYYITAVNATGESPASATMTANIPAQMLTSNPQHLFSSGTLVANWLDGQGNPASAPFAALQDIGTDLSFDRKDLWDAVINSVFPIDSADSMGKLTFKIGNATISADTLQRIVAGQLATAGGVMTLTLPKSVKLPVFSAVLTLVDTKGRTITVNLNLVKAKGVTLPFKINDFVIEAFEIDCYPDANGVIGSWVFGA